MRRSSRRFAAVAASLATFAPAHGGRAATIAKATTGDRVHPFGPGELQVDVAKRLFWASPCRGLGCGEGRGTRLEIPTEIVGEKALDDTRVAIAVVALARGEHATRVVVSGPGGTGRAWEAIVVGAASTGAPVVLWSGVTGFDADGEGARVLARHDGLFVGTLRRAVTICGQTETLLDPQRVDATTRTLRPVALPRLSSAVMAAAPTLDAVATSDAPIGSILSVRGASTHDGAAPALTDDDLATAWTEARAGDGRGEFVTFAVRSGLPLARLSIVARPTTTDAAADAYYTTPTSLWVVTDAGALHVRLPAEAAPGVRFDVVFPVPIATSCLSIALDATADDAAEVVRVGLAEVAGVPVVPSTVHTLDDLVGRLDEDEPARALATALLSGAGARGAQAIAHGLLGLGERGRDFAEEILESAPCGSSAAPLARLAWDAPIATKKAARAALDACGATATPALEEAFAAGPDAARETLASRFAKHSPARALPAIATLLATARPAARRAYRAALTELASTSTGLAALARWLAAPSIASGSEATDETATSRGIVEVARAVAEPLCAPRASEEGHAVAIVLATALLARATEAAPMALRWQAAEPIARLARANIAGTIAWLRTQAASPDRYLRARAVSLIAGVPGLSDALVAALVDGDPRVRESALVGLATLDAGSAKSGDARGPHDGLDPQVVDRAVALLAHDDWTYVRLAAADSLGALPTGDPHVTTRANFVDSALAAALSDSDARVRTRAIDALVRRDARSQLVAIRARAVDGAEASTVRKVAVDALGRLCDRASIEPLTAIAKRAGESEGELGLALSAIVALGRLHPDDLAARLSAIDRAQPVIHDAVARAQRAAAECR